MLRDTEATAIRPRNVISETRLPIFDALAATVGYIAYRTDLPFDRLMTAKERGGIDLTPAVKNFGPELSRRIYEFAADLAQAASRGKIADGPSVVARLDEIAQDFRSHLGLPVGDELDVEAHAASSAGSRPSGIIYSDEQLLEAAPITPEQARERRMERKWHRQKMRQARQHQPNPIADFHTSLAFLASPFSGNAESDRKHHLNNMRNAIRDLDVTGLLKLREMTQQAFEEGNGAGKSKQGLREEILGIIMDRVVRRVEQMSD